MTRPKNMFQHKIINKKIDEQVTLGYPRFKESIAMSLVEDYRFEYDEALRLAFSSDLNASIMEDIFWVQHMGPEYWAEVIADRHVCLS